MSLWAFQLPVPEPPLPPPPPPPAPVDIIAPRMHSNVERWRAYFKELDRLINELQRPKSALELAERLYDKVNRKEELEAYVIILHYLVALRVDVERWDARDIERFLREEKQKAPTPLAEKLLEYMRAVETQQTLNSVYTYNLEDKVEYLIRKYNALLDDKELLSESVKYWIALRDNYEQIEIKYRPTWYDVLVSDILDFYRYPSRWPSDLKEPFRLYDEAAFASVEEFIAMPVETTDKLSRTYQGVTTYQDWLAYRLSRPEEQEALLHADLSRLDFVYTKSEHPKKRNLYVAALNRLLARYPKSMQRQRIYHLIGKVYVTEGDGFKGVDETLRTKYVDALKVWEKGLAHDPESNYATQLQRSILVLTRPKVQFEYETYFSTKEQGLLKISYHNVDKLHLKILRISTAAYLKHSDLLDEDDFEKYLANKPVVKAWTVDLPLQKSQDYRWHSTEIFLPELDKGRYVVLAGIQENMSPKDSLYKAFSIQVSDLRYLQEHRAGVLVVNAHTGHPEKDVKLINAKALKRDVKYIDKPYFGRTNAAGMWSQKEKQGASYDFLLCKGADTLYDDRYTYMNNTIPEEEKRSGVHLFVDRSIYRPGQEVYYKGLVFESHSVTQKSTLLTTKKLRVNVNLYDANGQKVATQEAKVNKYGSIAGSFKLPTTGRLGQMRIAVDYAGSTYFRVEEYKRPKFEVLMDTLQGQHRLEDTVRVTGQAKAYAGIALNDVTVRYRVKRQARFPLWPWYRSMPYADNQAQEIASGEIETDAQGQFSIDFLARADQSVPRSDWPVFVFKVEVDVIDVSGEVQSSSTEVRLGYHSANISLDYTERMSVNQLKPLTLIAKNLNGAPTEATGTLRIERLKAPKQWYKERLWSFPEIPSYEGEAFTSKNPWYVPTERENNFELLPVEEVVGILPFDTKESKTISLPKLSEGRYRLVLISTDASGHRIERLHNLWVGSNEHKEPIWPKVLDVTLNKTSFAPKETMEITLRSSVKGQMVYVRFTQGYKVLREGWHTVKGGKTIKFAVTSAHYGEIQLDYATLYEGRFFLKKETVQIPRLDKKLSISYATFRDKLRPGAEETWKLIIKDPSGAGRAAELVASMYDASLEAIEPRLPWSLPDFWPAVSSEYSLVQGSTIRAITASKDARLPTLKDPMWSIAPYWVEQKYMNMRRVYEDSYTMSAAPSGSISGRRMQAAKIATQKIAEEESTNDAPVQIRENLNETVFFYPQMHVNRKGEVELNFTMNEALTRWRLMLFAHTKDLATGFSTREVITQKELMLLPNVPRFVREGDTVFFSTKISNVLDKKQSGTVHLTLLDGENMQTLNDAFQHTEESQPFEVAAKSSTVATFRIVVPKGVTNTLVYKLVAKGTQFSDGEQSIIPVLSNRMLVTETIPLAVQGDSTAHFDFKALDKMDESPTLKNERLQLSFTPNPAWYAIKSLPYLMEYPYECSEQLFSRLYANSLASNLAHTTPKIKEVFESWKSSGALESPLAKNEHLKSILLEETPWVLQAQSEKAQQERLGLLFDLNRLATETTDILEALKERQEYDGGFPWFEGGDGNTYITQHIVSGTGHLKHLGVSVSKQEMLDELVSKAIEFTDSKAAERYKKLQKWVKKEPKRSLAKVPISYLNAHYLYMRSFYSELEITDTVTAKMHEYLLEQAKTTWNKSNIYAQGLLALALHRAGDSAAAQNIVISLKERAQIDKELGMYWNFPGGYLWYQLPIRTHALLIEVFNEVAQDKEAVHQLRVWLLKQKEGQHWPSTKSTTAAIYALLSTGDDWLATTEMPEIKVAGKTLNLKKVKKEAGTGAFTKTWAAEEVTENQRQISIKNRNKVPAWGAMYWQYFEELDRIKSFKDTLLTIQKGLFKKTNGPRGEQLDTITAQTPLRVGDIVVVRLVVTADRKMDYVHVKDLRAASFEPVDTKSTFVWGSPNYYYKSIRDASVNFFLETLNEGAHTFTYELKVTQAGQYSNGLTTVQSMYAPAFSTHSKGIRVNILPQK